MKETKKIVLILLLIIMLFSNFSNIFAKVIIEGNQINLKFDHDCVSVLKIKGRDQLKQVAYVCYIDPDTGISYPAFCVEPANSGIGTGAGDNYDVTISSLDNPILWRMLYKGYVGSSYTSWGLDCDDDLYFATKTAVHCFADGSSPKEKYEIPHRVGYGDDATLEAIQARGVKVLEVAQEIYDYGYNSLENYINAKLTIEKGESMEMTINKKKCLVQNYFVTSNKEISSYNVNLSNFPKGTKILNSSNTVTSSMTNSIFKIAIPEEELTENFTGIINVNNAEIKSFPIFYCASGDPSTQDYVISCKTEIMNAQTILELDVYKSTLKIIKSNEENNPVSDVVFNLKYSDGTDIGDYTTDKNGTITVSNLKQGNIVVTEKNVSDVYVLDSASKNINLEYNSNQTLNVTNNFKKGSLKIIKVDKDNNDIPIPDVEFELLDSNKNSYGRYKTDKKGEIIITDLKIGDYYLIETKQNDSYYRLKDDIKITIEHNKQTTKIIQNEKKKGRIRVIKVDSDNSEIKLKGVTFEVLDENDNIIEEIKTDENGEALTSEYGVVNFSKLKIREKETLENYLLTEEIQTIELEENSIKSIVFKNKKKPELPKLPRTGF